MQRASVLRLRGGRSVLFGQKSVLRGRRVLFNKVATQLAVLCEVPGCFSRSSDDCLPALSSECDTGSVTGLRGSSGGRPSPVFRATSTSISHDMAS